ncbi:putative rhamnosyltransferase [Rhodobacter viridis]|uniref:Putative rhamnosyltransferase n=1 Tax=Rhodobacter viridis TaxID=1054202 RepID=A0A318U4W6_9RHOB|nr:glycosyltransferase [Rhodobacter viridis]PYF10958.1 putative rhamnosyltransferase [Rhodobacter viridis]
MTTEFRNQIVGLIRFSFVTVGDFYPGFDTVEDMKAFLFDEARLERRFRLFEGICLPTLKAQTDQDFTCIFLVSQDFPTKWRKRLDMLLEGLPFVQIVEKPPMNHYQGIREAFAEVPSAGFTHRTTFRLDDDDAVNLNFIATLRGLAEKVHMIPAKDEPIGISFNRGLYLTYSKKGTSYQRAVERTPLSIGTALLAPVAFAGNIYAYNHRALGQYHNTWMDQQDIVYLRTLHRDNKSNPHFSGSMEAVEPKRAAVLLQQKFGFDFDTIETLMTGT